MDRSYLFILVLLLCNSCITKVIGEDAESNSQYQQKFNDLNANDINTIFGQLSNNEVFRLATSDVTNPRIASFFVEIFRQRYQNYSIYIRRAYTSERIIVHDSVEKMQITDLEMVTKVFKAFGNVIKTLGIHEQSAKQVLENITSPFDEVNELFVGIEETVHSLPLTYLFPKLRKLSIELYSDSDYSYIDCIYPHLEHMDLSVVNFAWNQRDQIEGLIQKNSHIQVLSLCGCVSNYIKSISEWLPNLESLILEKFHIFDDAVLYNNLKHFNLRKNIELSSLNRVFFPHLESVKFLYVPSLNEDFKAFFFFHPHLRMVFLWDGSSNRIEFSEYANVLSDLPNLVDVKIGNVGSIEEIKAFMRKHQNLLKLELTTDSRRFEETEMGLMHNEFKNEWDMKHTSYKNVNFVATKFTFEKKNSTALQ